MSDKTTKRTLDQVSGPNDNDASNETTQAKIPRTNDGDAASSTPKRRGPGMFGVLVGTLNKIHTKNVTTDQAQIRHRQALDAKLQARLLQEKQELEAAAERKQAEQSEARAQRQAGLDAQRPVKIAAYHRQRAHFFLTQTTTPALPYLPKRLLPEQQERLDAQVDEATRVWVAAKETYEAEKST